MTTDTLTPDLIAAADDVADWAVSHAAEAGQHPTLPTVAEAPRFDIAKHYGWDAMTAARHEAQRRALAGRNPRNIK